MLNTQKHMNFIALSSIVHTASLASHRVLHNCSFFAHFSKKNVLTSMMLLKYYIIIYFVFVYEQFIK